MILSQPVVVFFCGGISRVQQACSESPAVLRPSNMVAPLQRSAITSPTHVLHQRDWPRLMKLYQADKGWKGFFLLTNSCWDNNKCKKFTLKRHQHEIDWSKWALVHPACDLHHFTYLQCMHIQSPSFIYLERRKPLNFCLSAISNNQPHACCNLSRTNCRTKATNSATPKLLNNQSAWVLKQQLGPSIFTWKSIRLMFNIDVN